MRKKKPYRANLFPQLKTWEEKQAYLKSILNYDQETGIFTWKVKRGKFEAGIRAGSMNNDGRGYVYRRIWLITGNFREHHLAYLWVAGHIPEEVDHKDGNSLDNRWDNLRAATRLQNEFNKSLSKRNTSGYRGVSAYRGRWKVQLQHKGKQMTLGVFDDKEEAFRVYVSKAVELFGDFAHRASKAKLTAVFLALLIATAPACAQTMWNVLQTAHDRDFIGIDKNGQPVAIPSSEVLFDNGVTSRELNIEGLPGIPGPNINLMLLPPINSPSEEFLQGTYNNPNVFDYSERETNTGRAETLDTRAAHSLGTRSSKFFVLTDHAEQFLSIPQLAKVDKPNDPLNDYYVLVLNWSVPMIKDNIPLVHFKWVRMEGQVRLASTSASSVGIVPRIIAVYPTVEAIDVAVQNIGMVQATVQPTWNGVSAASITGSDTLSTQFHVTVPIICGLSTSSGLVRWSYYPSKGQKIILGNKTGMVLLQIPKSLKEHCVVFDGALKYKLNWQLPFTHAEYRRSCSIDLRNAQSLDDVLATHTFDIPITISNTIKAGFSKAKEAKE